jgi:hypothetical protein
MAAKSDDEVPKGAAVLPVIPEELGVDPLLLAVLHATIFFDGSEENVVNQRAAREAMEYMADYLRRLSGPRLAKVHEDLACLAAFAREEGWRKEQIQFFKEFLENFGVGEKN